MKNIMLVLFLSVILNSYLYAVSRGVGGFDPEFTSIQEAIDLSSPGDKVYVNDGIYQEDLRIDKAFLQVEANGNNVILIPEGNQLAYWYPDYYPQYSEFSHTTHVFIEATGVVFNGFYLVGDDVPCSAAISVQHASDVRIYNCNIINYQSFGMDIRGSSEYRIENMYISGNIFDRMRDDNIPEDAELYSRAINFMRASGVVTDNTIENSFLAKGMLFYDYGNGTPSQVRISYNKITGLKETKTNMGWHTVNGITTYQPAWIYENDINPASIGIDVITWSSSQIKGDYKFELNRINTYSSTHFPDHETASIRFRGLANIEHNIVLQKNDLTGGQHGILLYEDPWSSTKHCQSIVIRHNNINDSLFGVFYDSTTPMYVEAKDNWWGSYRGPGLSDYSGDYGGTVTINVNYKPYTLGEFRVDTDKDYADDNVDVDDDGDGFYDSFEASVRRNPLNEFDPVDNRDGNHWNEYFKWKQAQNDFLKFNGGY